MNFKILLVAAVFLAAAGAAWAKAIKVTVITDQDCSLCSTAKAEEKISYYFPEAEFDLIDYRGRRARKIIKRLKPATLPYFIFPAKIKDQQHFEKLSPVLEERGKQFVLTKEASGLFLFLEREKIAGRIDLFFDFYHRRAAPIFRDLRQFTRDNNIAFEIHFIIPGEVGFGYPQTEIKTALAVAQLYPEKLLDYLEERLNYIKTLDCASTLEKMGLSYQTAYEFLRSAEGEKLLFDNDQLIKELGVTNGNVILINNRHILMAFQVEEEDLKQFFTN